MNYKLQQFFNFCESNDIKLLRDDIRFIKDTLADTPREFHSDALRGYILTWRNELRKEKKDGDTRSNPRREANKFLLNFRD